MIIEYNEIYLLSNSNTYTSLKTKFTVGKNSCETYDTEGNWMKFKFNKA